jgi:hypothetical protein
VLLVAFPDSLLLNGGSAAHVGRYLLLVLFVLWRLARGGRMTWRLLLALNLFLTIAIAATVGPGQWTVGAPLLFACSLASVGLLLSRSMREHVWPRSLPRARGISRA